MSMFARTSDPRGSERHTENTASLSLDFREQGRFCKLLSNSHVPFTVYSPCTVLLSGERVNWAEARAASNYTPEDELTGEARSASNHNNKNNKTTTGVATHTGKRNNTH